MALVEDAQVGLRVTPGSSRLELVTPVEVTADLADLASSAEYQVEVSAGIASDLLGDFGALPRTLHRDGTVTHTGDFSAYLTQWATRVGVTVGQKWAS